MFKIQYVVFYLKDAIILILGEPYRQRGHSKSHISVQGDSSECVNFMYIVC